MSYWKSTSKNTRGIDNFSMATSNNAGGGGSSCGEFYEMEMGVVLDIILDETHPLLVKGAKRLHTKIDGDRWPADVSGKKALIDDIDYTWIGRALIRPLISETLTDKDQLYWAYPLESNISEYPLINELVIVSTHGGQLYYSRKVNNHNWPNNALVFSANTSAAGITNTTLYEDTPFEGKMESVLKVKTNDILTQNSGFHGYAGKYFVANHRIRSLKRFEGDLTIESRHGQSIHMTAYDNNRGNDGGSSPDYVNGGNPMILIRNRQRPLLKEGQKLQLQDGPTPATITGTKIEKNVGGYIEENINHDGSSIHITSGKTISGWVTTCNKKMFGTGEEVPGFNGGSSFTYPTLDGDQIVIQSDRLILSSRYAETFHYSKKRYAVVTDSEYTVDAHDQIVLTTHVKTVINSPAIYLGEGDETSEPALLGQMTVNWLYELCNWLLEHYHVHHHGHVNAGKESPETTQLPTPPQIIRLTVLRDNLHAILSRRVFLTGGGLAPGSDGAYLG